MIPAQYSEEIALDVKFFGKVALLLEYDANT